MFSAINLNPQNINNPVTHGVKSLHDGTLGYDLGSRTPDPTLFGDSKHDGRLTLMGGLPQNKDQDKFLIDERQEKTHSSEF